MWRRIISVVVLAAVTGGTASSAQADDLPDIDVAALATVNDSNADLIRGQVRDLIWPAGYPTTEPVITPMTVWPSKLNLLTVRPPVEALTFNVDNLLSTGFLLTPTPHPQRWAIVHQGHIPHDTSRFLDFGIKATIESLLNDGWAVAVIQMPMQGWNTDHTADTFSIPSSTQGTANHKALEQQAGFDAESLRYFLNPVVETLNVIDGRPGGDTVTMVGVSGGGWTTHVAAALDTRIDVSIPVSGSLPLFARPYSPGSETLDPEQVYAPIFADTSPYGYLNLYLLATTGDRVQVQVINRNDNCCFGGDAHLMYSDELHDLDPTWQVYVDDSHSVHQISPHAISQVVLAEHQTPNEPPPTTTVPGCPA